MHQLSRGGFTRVSMRLALVLTALCGGLSACDETKPSGYTGPPLVPLWGWYNPSVSWGDYLTSSDPAWTTSRSEAPQGHVFQRIGGFVFSPSAPQPPDTGLFASGWGVGGS